MKLRSTRSFMPALTRTLVLAAGLVGVSTVLGGLKAAFLDQLPFREPENLVTISGVSHPAPPDFIERFAGRPSLEGVTQLRHGRATWNLTRASRRVDVVLIDHVALDLLGLEVVRGRGFTFADRQALEAALVSQTFMERALNDSTGTLGQLLEINGRHYTVVGIAPEALSRLGPFEVVLPRPVNQSGLRVGQAQASYASTVGRKRRGASLSEVLADMERLQRGQERPGMGQSTVGVAQLGERLVRPSLPTLQMLSFAALVLILLAAVTVAMLAAMQSAERLNEFAVRSALGASRQKLRWEALRPWIHAVLPATGVAVLVSGPLSQWIWSTLPSLGEVTPWTLETILTTLGMGVLLTAAAATGTLIPHEILARQLGGGSLNANPRSERIGRIFTGVQVAATVGLLCAAGVAIDALWRQSTRDLGIGPGQVFQIDVHLGEGTSKEAAASAWQRISTETLQSSRGHVVSSWASGLPWTPLSGWWISSETNPKGFPAAFSRVGPGFFETLGAHFVEGSDPFAIGGAWDVVVMSKSLAKSLGASVGSVVRVNDDPIRLAGIVNDISDPASEPQGIDHQMYLAPAFSTQVPLSASVFVRGSPKDALQLRTSLETAVPGASFSSPSSLSGGLTKRLGRERLGATALSLYGLLAILLIVLGLGGAMRRRVAQRMHEVGIRLSLGASIRQINEAMLKPIVGPALVGLVLGIALGYQMALAVAALMSWARPLETAVYAGSAMAGIAIVLVASWPALRVAGRARPSDLLRRL